MTLTPCCHLDSQQRAEDFEAEEPELSEADAIRGRQHVADLRGCAPIVKLLESSNASVLCGAANALFNLTLSVDNADSLLELEALPMVTRHLAHQEPSVKAAMAGVLMNCCATSVRCREQLSTQGLLGVVLPLLESAIDAQEKEVLKNALGTLNNLLLDKTAAVSLRAAGGILVVDRLLREALHSESLLEDSATSLLRVVQEDEGAGDELVERGTMEVLMLHLENPNEELQVRTCGLIYGTCEQVPSVRKELHKLGVVKKLLPLLTSSAEEVQESAARAIEKMSRMPAAAVAVRRNDGVQLLVDLLSANDFGVKVHSPLGASSPYLIHAHAMHM